MVDRNSSTPELEKFVGDFYDKPPYPPHEDFALDFCYRFDLHCKFKFGKRPTIELLGAIGLCVQAIYEYETPRGLGSKFQRQTHSEPVAHGRYRDSLLNFIKFIGIDHSLRLELFRSLLQEVFEPLIAALPPRVCITTNASLGKPSVPVLKVLANPDGVLQAMLAPFERALEDDNRFHDYRMGAGYARIFEYNIQQRLSRIDGTLFPDIFETLVPAPPAEIEPLPPEPIIADANWYAHGILLAMTRFGKTNAISWRIAQLLPQIAAGKASLVLMEPKGVLTEDLLQLAQLWDMRDRVVIIDPSDTSVSVNLFERSGTVNETVARITRVMNTITSNLTELQRDTLTFAIRALFCLPGTVSMRTLMTLLRQGKKALPMDELPESVREFFEYDFQPGDARYVIARLNGLLANPVFEALFAGDRTTFNMLTEIQAGKIILIKATGRSLAGEVTLYGRFWIEQINKCIWPRLALPADQRMPTTFIIDEAQNYIADDPHIAEMLDQAAEAKIGLLFAMHHMGQIQDDHVKHSIYTNTAVKFSARTTADIHNLSRAMGDAENLPKLLPNLPKFQFYMYTPDLIQPTKVMFPLVDFGAMPRTSPQQYDELKRINRERYGYARSTTQRHTSEDASASESDQVREPSAAIASEEQAASSRDTNGARTTEDHDAPIQPTSQPQGQPRLPSDSPTEGSFDWR